MLFLLNLFLADSSVSTRKETLSRARRWPRVCLAVYRPLALCSLCLCHAPLKLFSHPGFSHTRVFLVFGCCSHSWTGPAAALSIRPPPPEYRILLKNDPNTYPNIWRNALPIQAAVNFRVSHIHLISDHVIHCGHLLYQARAAAVR